MFRLQYYALLIAVCCFLFTAREIQALRVEEGFSAEVPDIPPYDRMYAQHYTNLRFASPSKLLVRIVNESSSRTSGVHTPRHELYGSGSSTNSIHAGIVIPLEVSPRHILGVCDEQQGEQAYYLRGRLTQALIPGVLTAQSPLLSLLVLSSSAGSGNLDLQCLIAVVDSFNRVYHKLPGIPVIDSLIVSGADIARSRQSSPLTLLESTHSRGGIDIDETRGYTNVSVLMYDTSGEAATEWAKLAAYAHFNRERWQRGYVHPYYIVQVRDGAYLLQSASFPNREEGSADTRENTGDPDEDTVCFASATPTCEPLGGWTVWASTTGDTSWEWASQTQSFVKKTSHGAAALLISSTVPSLPYASGKDMSPGVDGAASAIVAAVAIMDAVKRLMPRQQLYTFFFPAEHTGSVGSARIMRDAGVAGLPCAHRAGIEGPDACRVLAYGDALNFTTVNFSCITTVIALDQLSFSGGEAFYHIDDRVDQQNERVLNAAARLEKSGVQLAGSHRLPYSPTTTFLDFYGTSTADAAVLTVARYNTTYVNPHVFTPSDTPATGGLSVKAVADASNAVLHVLTGDSTATVNESLLSALWHCFAENFDCAFLRESEGNSAAAAAATSSVRVPDYSVGLVSTLESEAVKAISAALRAVGIEPLKSPAVPPSLEVGTQLAGPWRYDSHWSYPPFGAAADIERYALHAVSIAPRNVGARAAMVASAAVSNAMLAAGVSFMTISSFAFFYMFCYDH